MMMKQQIRQLSFNIKNIRLDCMFFFSWVSRMKTHSQRKLLRTWMQNIPATCDR
jgi:hypothetical protein